MRRDWAAHCRTHGLDSTCHRPWQWQRRRLLYLRAAGPTAADAGSCSYLPNGMSRSAHQHHLRVICWLAWCSRQTSRAAARLKAGLMRGCLRRRRSTSGLLLCTNCTYCVHHMQGGADETRRDWAAHCRTHGLGTTCHRPWQWQRRRLLYLRAAGPTAAATSADTDEHGRVGVDGLGPSVCAAGSSRKRSTSGLLHVLRAPHAGRSG